MTVSFLLGAGSSKPLGIPTTEGMAKDFLSESTNKLLKRVFDKKTEGDIETLVKAVHQIKELRNNHGIHLLRLQGNSLDEVDEISKSFAETEKQLTKFIREKCLKPNISKAVELYKQLLELSDLTTVKIFTTNYDVVIEEVCHNIKLKYSDGFVSEEHGYYKSFVPNALSQENIRLYKIHGSVNWWADETRQKIIKLSPEDASGREKYVTTMIYPAEKDDIFNYPFNLLQWFFGNDLNNTKKLYAIGHKFRDPNITATIKASLENPEFKLIIINPSATKIRKDIFEDHDRVDAIEKTIEEWMENGIQDIRNEVIKQNKKMDKEKKEIESENKKMNESHTRIRELQDKISDYERGLKTQEYNIFSTSDPSLTYNTALATDTPLPSTRFLISDTPHAIDFSTATLSPFSSTSTIPGRCPNCSELNSMGADKVCIKCGFKFEN